MSERLIADTKPDDIQLFSTGMGTYAGTRLVTLEDGVERGMRVIEMRSGGGLEIDVTVDRSGDIARLSLNGETLSWHPESGLAAPWNINREGDNGQGFLRGYGGFLNTCGLDHIRQPETDTAEEVDQEKLGQIDYPLHGKGTFHPATLRGHGLIDDVEVPYIFCEIEFVQAMSFVSALRLRRRIEIDVGSQSIRLHDTVRNVGSNATTHMLLYHCNLGFPLVCPNTTVTFGDDPCVWQSEDHDPAAPFPAPRKNAPSLLSVHQHTTKTGKVRIESAQTGLRMDMSYPAEQLPYCQMLKVAKQGIYSIGIEPCTTAARTRAEARRTGEMIVLQPSESRRYELTIDFNRLRK